MAVADLSALTGEDAPFEDFGPRPPRHEPLSSSLSADPGGLTVAGPDDAAVGNVSWVWRRWGPNPPSANPVIGIWLAPGARGRGVGARAQRALVELFWRHTTVSRVEAHTDVDNRAERRALEAAGFTLEATARAAQWRDGAHRDIAAYVVLRPGPAEGASEPD
ncbi:GNAT family N-acetyltransferase [Nocardioides panacisoli]|nr:GNAT family N-acetyltransferase [Nocardioides panacisoli]